MEKFLELLYYVLTVPIIAAFVVPLALTIAAALMRIGSRPAAPKLSELFWQPLATIPRLEPQDVAIGIDLLFAAIGSQVGFLALYAGNPSLAARYNPLCELIFERRITQPWISISILVLLLSWGLLSRVVIRSKGYEAVGNPDTGQTTLRLNEPIGVMLHLYLGGIALFLVYLANPSA